MNRVVVIGVALALGCGKKSDESQRPVSGETIPGEDAAHAEPPSPPALPDRMTLDVLETFIPKTLCGLPRDRQTRVAQVIAASFAKGERRANISVSAVLAEDLELARKLYAGQYQREVSGPWGVYTRSWSHERHKTREASIIVRNSINISLSTTAPGEPPNPVDCLLELDLRGLVDLAARAGGDSGLANLDFEYTDEQWAEHKLTITPRMTQLVRNCDLDKKKRACESVAPIRRDCKAGRFDAALAETDFHLTPKERANFRRTWDINCELVTER